MSAGNVFAFYSSARLKSNREENLRVTRFVDSHLAVAPGPLQSHLKEPVKYINHVILQLMHDKTTTTY